MERANRALDDDAAAAAREAALVDWYESLSDYKPKAVLVFGPDPRGAGAGRDVVALHPWDFLSEARFLGQSNSYGFEWRASGAPLVAWKNLSLAHESERSWVSAWLDRGALSMVRVDFPTALGQGFECFMFCGREFSDADDPKRVAYAAMSVWPAIKSTLLSRRYQITAREIEVLLALADGLTVKEAGERVGCAERTIGFHLANLQEKLRASNRAAVVQRACVLGLL